MKLVDIFRVKVETGGRAHAGAQPGIANIKCHDMGDIHSMKPVGDFTGFWRGKLFVVKFSNQ